MPVFGIPDEGVIHSFELVFLLVFASGMIATVNYINQQYPNVGVTLMGMGLLLLYLAKRIRKKRDAAAVVAQKN